MWGCIEQHKPAALVVTCRIKASRLDAFHIAKRILLPREVALRWVAKEVWRLAKNTFTLSRILCPAFQLLRGDGKGNDIQGRSQSSHTNYRGMVVSEVGEVTPSFTPSLWAPGKALRHQSESGRATRSENHRVLLRGGVKMLQNPI